MCHVDRVCSLGLLSGVEMPDVERNAQPTGAQELDGMAGQLSVQAVLEAGELMSAVRVSFLEDRSIPHGQKAIVVRVQSGLRMFDVRMIGSLAEEADHLARMAQSSMAD